MLDILSFYKCLVSFFAATVRILAVLHKGVSYLSIFNVTTCLLNCRHAMKACKETEVEPHPFLTGALDGGEWSASHPRWFNPGERAPSTH